jgi:hypothetical protein
MSVRLLFTLHLRVQVRLFLAGNQPGGDLYPSLFYVVDKSSPFVHISYRATNLHHCLFVVLII